MIMIVCRGDQPIHLAAQQGHQVIVSALLKSGCSLTTPGQHGNTVLHCAAQSAQLGVVQLCLGSGADPNQGNNWGETPLHLVAAFFSRGKDNNIYSSYYFYIVHHTFFMHSLLFLCIKCPNLQCSL